MSKIQKGFTLIELMIVVAIIAILAAIALPAYQDYVIRSKITEGVIGATAAKTAVSEGFQTNGMTGLATAANEYPLANIATASKYVQFVEIPNPLTGEIRVTFLANVANGIPTTLNGNTLFFTPYVNAGAGPLPLAPNLAGPIDWGCQSQTATQSAAQGMGT
jgi:type IV pilus assembly protein PilA